MAVLGLRFCARAFSSCGNRGPLFIMVRGPLTVAASPIAEHRLQTRRLSNCGAQAQLLCGMWDPPRPGLEPVSPALAGGFSTTAPPGKPASRLLIMNFATPSSHLLSEAGGRMLGRPQLPQGKHLVQRMMQPSSGEFNPPQQTHFPFLESFCFFIFKKILN